MAKAKAVSAIVKGVQKVAKAAAKKKAGKAGAKVDKHEATDSDR